MIKRLKTKFFFSLLVHRFAFPKSIKSLIEITLTGRQGRIHGCQSRVRVGRSSNENSKSKHLGRGSIAGTARKHQKANGDRQTDGRTDRPS